MINNIIQKPGVSERSSEDVCEFEHIDNKAIAGFRMSHQQPAVLDS
jgi:hypothetical protein